MGRNPYINFYMWFYSENRGQAPVTTIAKRAGITWRKMTPQEKDRFMDQNFHLKGKMPLYIAKEKFQKVNITKTPHKRITKSKRSSRHGKQLKSTSQRNVRKRQTKTVQADLKEEACRSIQEVKSGNKDDAEQKSKVEKEENESKSESEETLVRQKGIQRWMDENHYT